MPTSPERPPSGTGASDREDALAAAEAAHLSERETVPLDVRPRAPGDVARRDGTDRPDRHAPADRGAAADRGDAAERGGAAGRGGVPEPGDLAHRETVRLPAQRGGAGRGRRRAPLAVAAAFATVWAAMLSYLPVAVVLGLTQLVEDTGSPGGAARAGLAGWLLGHGVPLGTGIGPLGLAPLALTLLAGWRLARAGVHVTRAIGARGTGSVRAALTASGCVGLGYGVLGALAALLVDGPGLTVSPLRAGLTLAGFGLAGAAVGALRCTGSVGVLAARVPAMLRHAVRTGTVAVLLILAAGTGLAGLSVALGGGEAGEMIRAYRTGVAGQAGITVLSMAYIPNAAVWAGAYLLGPGFLLGTGTAVQLTEVTVGALPAVPVLAGLPEGPLGGIGVLLLVLPVLAGVVAGWLLARRMRRETPPGRVTGQGRDARPVAGPPWSTLLGAAVFAGPAAGLLFAGLAAISGGPLGAGRLTQVGPVPWQVGVVVAGVVTAGALLGAATTRAFRPTQIPHP